MSYSTAVRYLLPIPVGFGVEMSGLKLTGTFLFYFSAILRKSSINRKLMCVTRFLKKGSSYKNTGRRVREMRLMHLYYFSRFITSV